MPFSLSRATWDLFNARTTSQHTLSIEDAPRNKQPAARTGDKVIVKYITGRMCEVPLELCVSVADLKQYLQGRDLSFGLPVHQQKVVYYGKALEDHALLSRCGIRDGSVVYCAANLQDSECISASEGQ
jgi:hypothetical protein